MAQGRLTPGEAGPRPGLAVRIFSGLIRGYQLVISPVLGPRCRHLPSCSEYAAEALREHGVLRGGWLAVRRIVRCHPWGSSGYDPVPRRGAGG